MSPKSNSNNRQVRRTKSWIFDALMLLMDEKPYNKITISDITEKAGIARQTFYRSYENIDDILMEYLMNTFNSELLKIESVTKNKQDNIVFMFNHAYMVKHRDTLKKILSVADIENRIYHETQRFPMTFMENYKGKLSPEEELICRYKLLYQITGCLRVLSDWFINDMPAPVENIVSMLNAMNVPKTVQYRNFPNIVVRTNND